MIVELQNKMLALNAKKLQPFSKLLQEHKEMVVDLRKYSQKTWDFMIAIANGTWTEAVQPYRLRALFHCTSDLQCNEEFRTRLFCIAIQTLESLSESAFLELYEEWTGTSREVTLLYPRFDLEVQMPWSLYTKSLGQMLATSETASQEWNGFLDKWFWKSGDFDAFAKTCKKPGRWLFYFLPSLKHLGFQFTRAQQALLCAHMHSLPFNHTTIHYFHWFLQEVIGWDHIPGLLQVMLNKNVHSLLFAFGCVSKSCYFTLAEWIPSYQFQPLVEIALDGDTPELIRPIAQNTIRAYVHNHVFEPSVWKTIYDASCHSSEFLHSLYTDCYCAYPWYWMRELQPSPRWLRVYPPLEVMKQIQDMQFDWESVLQSTCSAVVETVQNFQSAFEARHGKEMSAYVLGYIWFAIVLATQHKKELLECSKPYLHDYLQRLEMSEEDLLHL